MDARVDVAEREAAIVARLEELALVAGGVIMEIYRTGFDVERKADCSPVTEADRLAEAVILKGLRESYPDTPIVAEEEASAGHLPDRLDGEFFLVDPLDGTKEFINRRNDFTVNIALVRQGVPVIGAVYAPAKSALYSGRPGRAELMVTTPDHRIESRKAIRVREQRDVPTVVASRSHRTPETDAFIAKFPGAEIVSVGSSLKFCLLAEGAADLYPRFGRTMEWDTAAGDAVLRAAGGRTLTLDGEPLTYGKRNQPDDSDFANPFFVSEAWSAAG
ncbi:MAG TPA: 3'(2'),5'-bisphosphate nucleotidase CysQ [Rhizobiaceae bacterium]|nr:3'(2'),5'-bisphosphate nucleotidase CysQ [Rhizobiaceae bacterium]